MANIKLYYFDNTGRGELCRLLLAASGHEWEDVRFSQEEWIKYKPDAPFGQAPYLEYNGKKYAQSVALATFLAKEFGLGGKSNVEALQVDQVVQLVQDLFAAIIQLYNEQDESRKEELLEKIKDQDVPRFFGYMEKLLQENGSGYFVGKEIAMADMAVYDAVTNIVKGPVMKMMDADEDFPLIQGVCAKVAAHPNIRKYLDKHRSEKSQ